MRAELTGGGINDLKFFFYADSKAVSHGVALRVLGVVGTAEAISYPAEGKITLRFGVCIDTADWRG